ncbi:MAG: glycosyltransferase [Lentisphaerae bacterium]|nr:glycosyltransferase [Lentisphaerota bacterium]
MQNASTKPDGTIGSAPLLSIIIPFKNEERTLPLVLDSLARQQVAFPYEVILADGCSTDRSVEVIRSHPLSSKVPVTILPLAPDNHGMTVARNAGAKVARGSLLLFMQSDIRIRDENALAKVARAFDDDAVVGTTFIDVGPGGEFLRYDFWGQFFMSRFFGSRVEQDFDTKFNGVRKTAFDRIGGFDEQHYALGGEDFNFLIRLSRTGTIADTDVEVEHLHGFNKRHGPLGLLKKYARNSEVFGVTLPFYWKHRTHAPGFLWSLTQQAAVCTLCILSLIPAFWLWTGPLLLAMGAVWSRKVYRHIRNWRLIWVPFFSVLVLFVFTVFFLKGLITGKTGFVFDNKMR